MKPNITGIDIDIQQDNIQIVLQTSEGEKHIDLLTIYKGCYICSSDVGGLSQTSAGIFVTINGQRTQKI